MSLLMDALKKAEMAKRQGSNADAELSGLPGLSLEPVITPVPLNLDISSIPAEVPQLGDPTTLEPTSSNTEWASLSTTVAPASLSKSLDSPEITSSKPVDVTRAGAATNIEPDIVRDSLGKQAQKKQSQADAVAEDRKRAENLFQAKQPEPKEKGKRAFAIALGATTFLSLVAIGGYFWWQLQPRTGLGPVAQGVARPPQNPPALLPSTAPALPTSAPIVAQTANTTPTESAPSAPPLTTGTLTPPAVQPQTQAPSRVAKSIRREEEEEESAVRITKTPLRTNPSLSKAYEAASRGDSATAKRAYAGVLASEPQNSDAILGMATLAVREGRLADAERYFQQALVANPQEPTAIAGLANIYARTNPVQAESRLKALASAQPEHAAAHIALGNLFLAQQRWQEAQQSYFTAYTTQPENPDLLFNLAISLEHINQPRLAVQYYREALVAAKRGTATFNNAQAEERLRALQP